MKASRLTNSAVRLRMAAPLLASCLASVLSLSAHALNYTVDLKQPGLDKLKYPFGGSGGTRTSASVFGAVGSLDLDDRDGELYTAFETGNIVPTGLGASNYTIIFATFTL